MVNHGDHVASMVGKGYFAGEQDYEDGDWDSRSQSLTGYTALWGWWWHGLQHWGDLRPGLGRLSMTRMKKATSSWALPFYAMMDLDFQNDEACALAAESLQLEQGKNKKHAASTRKGQRTLWLPWRTSVWRQRLCVLSWEEGSLGTTEEPVASAGDVDRRGTGAATQCVQKVDVKEEARRATSLHRHLPLRHRCKHGSNGKNYKPRVVLLFHGRGMRRRQPRDQGLQWWLTEERGLRLHLEAEPFHHRNVSMQHPTTSMSSPYCVFTQFFYGDGSSSTYFHVELFDPQHCIQPRGTSRSRKQLSELGGCNKQFVKKFVNKKDKEDSGTDGDFASATWRGQVGGWCQSCWSTSSFGMKLMKELKEKKKFPFLNQAISWWRTFPLVGTPERQRHLDRFLEMVWSKSPWLERCFQWEMEWVLSWTCYVCG